MNKLAFGLTMMIIGIGGTFLTLIILIWSIELLKKLFPLEPTQALSLRQLFPPGRDPFQWTLKLPLDRFPLQSSWRLPIDKMQVQWKENAFVSSLRARIIGAAAARASTPEKKASEADEGGRATRS